MKNKIAILIIVASLCSVYYHNVKMAVVHGPHLEYKVTSYLNPQFGLKTMNNDQKYFWKGRIISCSIAGMFCYLSGSDAVKFYEAQKKFISNKNQENYNKYVVEIIKLGTAIGAFSATVLFITLLVIVLYAKNPLFFIFGFCAALQYAWLPMSEGQVNPWDQFAILSWLIILLVDQSKHRMQILWMIPLFSALKETTIVLSVLILFWGNVPIKKRIGLFLLSCGATVLIKVALSYIGGSGHILTNQSWHYETKCRTGEYWIIERNFHSLGWWSDFNPIYFSISGLWAALFLMPVPVKYKAIGAVYLVSIFGILPGNTTEGRLWQELIPLFFVGYENKRININDSGGIS